MQAERLILQGILVIINRLIVHVSPIKVLAYISHLVD